MSDDDEGSEDADEAGVERDDVEMPWMIQTMVCLARDLPCLLCHSQWWGEGGSSLGWATVLLAKLLNAAEEGLIHSGTRLEFNCS